MVILGMKMLLMMIWFDFLVNYFRRFGSLMKRLFIDIIRFRCRLIIYRLVIIYYFWSWAIGFGSWWFGSCCCGLGCGYNLIMCIVLLLFTRWCWCMIINIGFNWYCRMYRFRLLLWIIRIIINWGTRIVMNTRWWINSTMPRGNNNMGLPMGRRWCWCFIMFRRRYYWSWWCLTV